MCCHSVSNVEAQSRVETGKYTTQVDGNLFVAKVDKNSVLGDIAMEERVVGPRHEHINSVWWQSLGRKIDEANMT